MTQIIQDEDLKRRTSMTKENIINSCKKNKLYVTPKLNDVLYLHYQGYQKIENLDEYSELKCLWLECNAISQISGLEQQTKLRCLYLHNNFIRKIENLDNCKQLDTLNLSHNYVKTIEGCNSMILPELNTLDLSHNSLSSIDGLADLVECKRLSVLDLSHNRIEDVLIVKILSRMPELHVLTMTGNPVVSEIPSYRKTLTIECKNLTYLDSRPIFEKDRACAEAWKRGGYEEEKREHTKWVTAQQRKITDSVRATLRLRKKLAENRSPNSVSIEVNERANTNSQSTEPNDEPSKEISNDNVPDSVIDSVTADSIKLDQMDNCIDDVDTDTDGAIQLNNSKAEPEIHDADLKDVLSTLSHQNDGLCQLSDISGQCLDAAALLINETQPIPNENSKNSVAVGALDLQSNEFIDVNVNTNNILNIHLSDENVNAFQPATKIKPTIQVLSESNWSNSLEATDFEASNEADLNQIDCIDNDESSLGRSEPSQLIEERPIVEPSEKQLIETECLDKTQGNAHLNPKSSSTITFYCENLDDLKGIDTESDVDIDEI